MPRRIVEQHVMVVFIRQFISSVYLVRCFAVSTALGIMLREGNTCSLCQECDGFNKADAVDLLNEFENIASGTAAETVINLSLGTHAKRG